MAGSSNFQQWNPSQNNQEADADYLSDPQRVNGAANPSVFPSRTANKVFFQSSTFAAAFGAALAAKGYVVSDNDLGMLQVILSEIFTSQDYVPIAVTGAAPVCNLASSQAPTFSETLSANISPTVTNVVSPGQRVTFIFTQDGTGGRTVTWPGNVLGGGDVDPTPGAVSIQQFIVFGGVLRPLGAMTSS